MAIGKVAENCPAAICTEAGTLADVGSLETRLTLKLLKGAESTETVPLRAAVPSAAWEGIERAIRLLADAVTVISSKAKPSLGIE